MEVNEYKTPPPRGASSLKQREKCPKSSRTDSTPPYILYQASNWKMQVDLKKKLVFPEEVVVTAFRPDMVLLSRSTKHYLSSLVDCALQASHLS